MGASWASPVASFRSSLWALGVPAAARRARSILSTDATTNLSCGLEPAPPASQWGRFLLAARWPIKTQPKPRAAIADVQYCWPVSSIELLLRLALVFNILPLAPSWSGAHRRRAHLIGSEHRHAVWLADRCGGARSARATVITQEWRANEWCQQLAFGPSAHGRRRSRIHSNRSHPIRDLCAISKESLTLYYLVVAGRPHPWLV